MKLTKVYRQRDVHFVSILNEIRLGNPSLDGIEFLTSLKRPLCTHHGIVPTILRTKHTSVDSENNYYFQRLDTAIVKFLAMDSGDDEGYDIVLDVVTTLLDGLKTVTSIKENPSFLFARVLK